MDFNPSIHFTLPSFVLFALRKLAAHGYEAYAVGGAVRDLLRGKEPHDYDIATSATPEEMKAVFVGFRTVETGIKHGTLTVLIEGEPLEITTFRVDGEYTDARHPDSVSFTRSLREDTARRDFTVNAMAYNPDTGVCDFFGGVSDIENRVLRTVGESRLRFSEDALRILRALRFASVLGYRIEAQTASAIHELKHLLGEVAPERIREEFVKLIVGKDAPRVLREYADVIAVFLPEILLLIGFLQHNPHHEYDVWEHTLRALGAAPREAHLRLALLFHDIGKPSCFFLDDGGVGHFYGHAARSAEITDRVMRRLRFDNQTRERVTLLVQKHDTVPSPQTRQFARMRSRYGDAFLTDWLSVVRADRTGQRATLSEDGERVLAEAEEAARALLSQEDRISLSSLAIGGDDLIALGFRGREIGKALDYALSCVLDGKEPNEKERLLTRMAEQKAAPIECERKFLIRYPDTRLLLSLGAKRSEITQTYLVAEKGATERVRMRTEDGETRYTHTVKRRISSLSAIEEEKEISREEYELLLGNTDKTRRPVEKVRYALPYGGYTLEIDVYPFWTGQAVLEIELGGEDEEPAIPPFLSVIREVTGDLAYKNVSLAKEIPEEDKIP